MKFLLVASVLLVLVRFSEQTPSYCYKSSRFLAKLFDCLGTILSAELEDLSLESIDNFCTVIQRGASCMDQVRDECHGGVPRHIMRHLDAETGDVSMDYEDMCTRLRGLYSDQSKRSLHKESSTATLSKLVGLLPFN